MFRTILVLMACMAGPMAPAQDFSGLARVDMATSRVSDSRGGLSVDFREVDWRGVQGDLLDWAEAAQAVRVGGFSPGWSRMVVDLAGPYSLAASTMDLDNETGAARLEVTLVPATPEAFAAASGAPAEPGWAVRGRPLKAVKRPRQRGENPLVIVIDPGHGGIDPGAEEGGLVEKDLMLTFARELKEVLLRSGGFHVILTRERDEFISLERRVAIAHRAGADLFLSLHADALSEGGAHGATVYTLSESASDAASAALAERHNRADMLAGLDLTGIDDVVADVLFDLARMETRPRARQLAKSIRLGIAELDLPLNSRPHRTAGFSVLKSPDIPSVLLELGFLSSARDRENLGDAEWRRRMAEALRDALEAWRIADAAAGELVRQ